MCERSRRSASPNRFVENGEPIGGWQCTGSKWGRRRALRSRKVLRGRYTSERGGCHESQTFCNGGEVPGGERARAPRSGPRVVHKLRDEIGDIGRWRGVGRAGDG